MSRDNSTLKIKSEVGTHSYLGYLISDHDEKKDGVHPEVKLSKETLQYYEKERDPWALEFKIAEEFRNGAQWTREEADVLKSRGQNPIVVNRMHPIIETAKALLTTKKPQFRATGRDDSDNKTAKMFSDLFQYMWDQSNGNDELKRAIDDYYVGGMGVIQAYQDPHADNGKGEVHLKSLYPLDVYLDPNARDKYCRDSAHIIVARLMTDSEAYKIYPEFIGEIAGSVDSQEKRYPTTDLDTESKQIYLDDIETSDSNSTTREYIERYTRIKEPMHRVFCETSGMEYLFDDDEIHEYLKQTIYCLHNGENKQYIVNYDQVQLMHQQYAQFDGVYHLVQDPNTGQPTPVAGIEEKDPNAVPGSTTIMEQQIMQYLVELGKIYINTIQANRIKVICSVGDTLLYTRILPCEDYPIVTLMNIHNRTPYPESDVRIYKPLQEYINKIRSLIIAHASTSTNVKLLIPRGSVNRKEIEKEWGRAGTAVIEFDAELGQPVVAGPVPLPNELYKNETDAKTDLEYGFGIYELMQGGGGAPSTYRGTVAIDEYGQRRIKSRQDDVEYCLNQLARVCIPLMQQLYTETKVFQIINPNGTISNRTMNAVNYDNFGQVIERFDDVTVGKYDIQVVSGSTLPSNRFAQFEYYMELYKNGIIDQEELLKKTEVVDVEGVLQRMSLINQMKQQIAGLSQENKKLKGDMQTADRELKHARQRVEVEKFKGDLKDTSSKASMAGQLYKQRLGDQLTNSKRDLKRTEDVAKADAKAEETQTSSVLDTL